MGQRGLWWIVLLGVVGLGTAGAGPHGPSPPSAGVTPGDNPGSVERAVSRRDTVLLSPELMTQLGIKTEAAREATHPGVLVLRGTLVIDPAQMIRVRPRFGGEVVETGIVPDVEGGTRRLRVGDPVDRNQMLAVVWSSERSERKNGLLEALARARLKRAAFDRVKDLHEKGILGARNIQEADHDLEEAEIEAARADRSLRARRVSEAEVQAIASESRKVAAQNTRTPFDPERSWARFTVRSPIAGRVIEARAALSDTVDANEVIYEIADLSRVLARVKIHEAELPMVEALPKPVRWTLRLENRPEAPPLSDVVDIVGVQIDPADHTATLTGIVDNRDGRLHPGESITAEIALPAGPGLVEIPAPARIRGAGTDESFVFVQPDADEAVFTIHPVRPVRVSREFLTVRNATRDGLRPGDRVVTAGASKLKAILDGSAVPTAPARGQAGHP
jgi:cobalt-zinc-cadmium efflux system membrane fusion protein